MGTSAYPQISAEDINWLIATLEGMAKKPEDVKMVYRRREGIDLEIVFMVAPASQVVFSEEICLDLEAKIAKKNRLTCPSNLYGGSPAHSCPRSLQRVF